MIEAVKQFFQYAFIQNAIISAFLLSVITGFIGSYIVVRRLVFLSGGITHASFGGIGIAWYFGLNPILGATVFSVFSALGLEYLTQGRTLREDSAIGMLWSFGMAVGILCFPNAGLCSKPNVVPVRKHTNHFPNRYITAADTCHAYASIFCGFLLPNSFCGIR